MANKILKPKRGKVENLPKLAVEDGSLIFAYDVGATTSTVQVDIGQTRYGLAADSAKNADNSNALGGSSLKNITDEISNATGNGAAFVKINTATNNKIELTKANGSTVRKIINNVSNASTANYAKNANKLDGNPLTSDSRYFSAIPYLDANGALDIGSYIDFHNAATQVIDYDVRLAGSTNSLAVLGSSATTVTADYFNGLAKNSDSLGGAPASSYVTKEELADQSSTVKVNADFADHLKSYTTISDSSIDLSFHDGSLPSSVVYPAYDIRTRSAAEGTSTLFGQTFKNVDRFGIIHLGTGGRQATSNGDSAGTNIPIRHDLVFKSERLTSSEAINDASGDGSNNGIVYVTNYRKPAFLLDEFNYSQLVTKVNNLTINGGLTATRRTDILIDGGYYI